MEHINVEKGKNKEMAVTIEDDDEKNENYKGSVLYATVGKGKNAENIKSDMDAFCAVIKKCKTQLHAKNNLQKRQSEKKIGVKLISYMSERGIGHNQVSANYAGVPTAP